MADKAQTPPPPAAAVDKSSPSTPNPKRVRMSSPEKTLDKAENSTTEDKNVDVERKVDRKPDEKHVKHTESAEHAQPKETESATAFPEVESAELLTDDEDDLEADDGYADSAVGGDNSDSTSITSSIYSGYVENGRRYQSKREGEYLLPADEKQLGSQQKHHIVHCILDSERENPLFYSPIPNTAQNILDVGTGNGDWARDVADRFPSAFVQGVDLAPVPDNWMPPNCKFEVDDVLKPWEFKENGRFQLIHLRAMYGAFTDEQWRLLYKQAYNNLAPGGWIEQVEFSIDFLSDDGSLPADSLLALSGPMFKNILGKSGKKINTEETFKASIAAAGFTNLHEKVYKVPVGDWVKSPLLKEAGQFHKAALLEGFEGYSMFALTHFGEPTPWTPEEVQVYVAKLRSELNDPKNHSYSRGRRVWAQKPFGAAKA